MRNHRELRGHLEKNIEKNNEQYEQKRTLTSYGVYRDCSRALVIILPSEKVLNNFLSETGTNFK